MCESHSSFGISDCHVFICMLHHVPQIKSQHPEANGVVNLSLNGGWSPFYNSLVRQYRLSALLSTSHTVTDMGHASESPAQPPQIYLHVAMCLYQDAFGGVSMSRKMHAHGGEGREGGMHTRRTEG